MEYITLKDDKEIKLSFKQLAYINKLETKLFICGELLKGLSYQSTKKGTEIYIKELTKWKYKIDIKKDLQTEVNRIISDLKSLKSTIEITLQRRISHDISCYLIITHHNH